MTRLLLVLLMVLTMPALAFASGDIALGVWNGLASSTYVTITTGAPWELRVWAVNGIYHDRYYTWVMEPNQAWGVDMGYAFGDATLYAGNHHVHFGVRRYWTLEGFVAGTRGTARMSPDMQFVYDLQWRPTAYYENHEGPTVLTEPNNGFATSFGVRWQMNPIAALEIGHTHWQYLFQGGGDYLWSGLYGAVRWFW